ncbi:DUF7661 family protein [Salinibius halmophilus]|uniref:DUF7661 family protein n=1 Tax=Salinibius halmophilus TaxID=1853216 RepID=UPI000E66012D|nr:hypothetical protein [Salinibius halmophilus]
MKFDIYGKKVLQVIRKNGEWLAFYSGDGIKRKTDDIYIPASIAENELEEYIGDVFHEWATHDNHSIVRLTD